MKNKVKNILFLMIIFVLILFQILSNVSFAKVDNDIIVGKFKYGSTLDKIDRNGIYYYSDSYFEESGKILNSHLRTMSLNAALATFESADINGDYSKGSQNISKLLNDINFEDIEINDDFKIKPTEDTVGIIIGRKKIKNENIMVVSVRGSRYGAEWANNFTIGKDGYAKGFEQSAQKVLDYIKYYQNKYKINDTKIWMMGYSRSSAIINVVGTKINENLNEYHTSADDIYIYAFETPNSVTIGTTKYENIHNTINREDFVTYIPGKGWGLTRGGIDDTIIPSKGSKEYNELYNEFKKQYGKIDPEKEYIEDDFKEKYLTIDLSKGFAEMSFNVKEIDNSKLQSEFVNDFLNILNDEEKFINKGLLTREKYAEEVEPYITELLSLFMQKQAEEQNEIISYISSVGTDVVDTIKEEVNQGNYQNAILLFAYISSNPENCIDEIFDGLTNLVSNSLVKIQKPDSLSDTDVETIKNTISPLLKYLQPLIYEEFVGNVDADSGENYILRNILSIVNNISLLIQPHLSEVTLAWMRTMDTYYTKDGIQAGKIKQIESSDENFAGAKLESLEPSTLESLLSEEEKELVELGNDANIYLVVNKLEESEISNEDKDLIYSVMNSNMHLGFYLDINLLKSIGNKDPVNISNVAEKVKITIQIPDELLGKENYKIIRTHNNVADIIDAVIDGNNLTFETDRFSTYALVYNESSNEGSIEENVVSNIVTENKEQSKANNPFTGDSIIIWSVLMVVSIVGIVGIIMLKRRKSSNKH